MWSFKVKIEHLLKHLFQPSWKFWGGCRNHSDLFRNENGDGEQAPWSPAFVDPSFLSR